jgi:hypothetical protein
LSKLEKETIESWEELTKQFTRTSSWHISGQHP